MSLVVYGKRKAPYAMSQRGAITIRNPAYRPSSRAMVVYKKPVVARRRFRKGFQRTVGYFGRFTGSSPELKFFDTALSFNIDRTAEIPTTGQLCLIPQDDTQSGRDGNKACLHSILVKGTATFTPAAAATASSIAWIYVVQDTQANGQAATVADANSGIFTTDNLATANHVIANGNRFRVLKKFMFSMQPAAGAGSALNSVTKAFYWYSKLNVPLQYDASASTGALTTIRSNNIFLVAGCSDSGQDDLTSVQGTCRLRFSD